MGQPNDEYMEPSTFLDDDGSIPGPPSVSYSDTLGYGGTSNSSGHVGELCRGKLKKFCSGNTFNKWQSRFARVVSYDSNTNSIILEYAKTEKDILNGSKVKKST